LAGYCKSLLIGVVMTEEINTNEYFAELSFENYWRVYGKKDFFPTTKEALNDLKQYEDLIKKCNPKPSQIKIAAQGINMLTSKIVVDIIVPEGQDPKIVIDKEMKKILGQIEEMEKIRKKSHKEFLEKIKNVCKDS
jgi:hypothetical protein